YKAIPSANVPARYVAVTATAARPFPGVLMLLILPVLNLAQGCIRVNALCPFEALLSIRRLLEGRRRKMSFSRIRVPREAYRFSAAMLVHDRSMKLPISAAFGLVTGALPMTIYFHRRFGCPQNAPREI
ncbi:hypothetical protein KXX11_009201, partial [Aspergillus fumigatus]